MADKAGSTAWDLVERGLSRLLSYAYAGFLALIIFSIFKSDLAKKLISDLGWELVVLACIVIGAGIYRAHRSAVIPIHHLFACLLFRVWDWKNETDMGESVSPTRWFNSMKVPKYRRMLAYNVLRHDPGFMPIEEQKRLDLLHAEFGLVVMAAEGCFFGFVYTILHLSSNPAWWALWVWLGVSVLLFAASYPAPMQQHAIECLLWRTRENEETNEKGEKIRPVSTALRKYGLLEQQ